MQAVILKDVCKYFKQYPTKGTLTFKDAIIKGEIFKYLKKNSNSYRQIIKNISFSVEEGTTLGIVGVNGSGKTTLLRLITNVYRPDSGQIMVNGRVILLSLGLGFHPELTGRENIHISGVLYGLTPRQIREYEEDIIQFSELDEYIDAPVRTYSSGMYSRLAFSIAVNVNPDILLLDEILAVGDGKFRLKSLERINDFKRSGKTIILVTHSEDFAAKWCSKSIWLHNGEICAYGDSNNVISEYQKFLSN